MYARPILQASMLVAFSTLALLFAVTGSAYSRTTSPDFRRLQTRSSNATALTNACKSLMASNSSSTVNYFLSPAYTENSERYMTSTYQTPTCVYVPTTPQDLSKVVKLIGAQRLAFAVSSGKHASNKGFSTTTGIQISMKGFQNVTLSADKSYVDIGTGNIWDNVYAALEGSGVNIVGGRVSGVGVGGFITGGGGYSWKTNQYGLTIDTIIQADMVMPDGTLKSVTAQSDPDLFWAIKGGGNRFGIIYNWRLLTNPQTTQVYGGVRTYTFDQIDSVVTAVNNFSMTNKDPKAQVLPTFNFVLGEPGVSLLGFYDAPSAPAGVLDMFDAANGGPKPFTDGWKAQSFTDFVRAAPANATGNTRGAFMTVSFQNFSQSIIEQCANQSKVIGAQSFFHGGTFISYDVEPFLPTWAEATNKGGAWPHDKSPLPLNLYYAWQGENNDAFWNQQIRQSAALLRAQAVAEGQDLDGLYLYPNYALADVPAEQLWGTENAARLETLRQRYDPQNVMLLTTSFSFV